MKSSKTEWAWISIDAGNSAFATCILASVFPIYLPSLLPEAGVEFNLGLFSWTSSALSVWAYSVSFSVFVTLLLSPILGAWADQSGQKRLALAVFSFLGAVSTCALGVLDFWPAVLLSFVLANIGFTGGNVFYNSLLPYVTSEDRWDKISLSAFAWGYISGALVLSLNLLLILKFQWFGFESKVEATRLGFIIVGIWWALFIVPALIFIKEDRSRDPESPALSAKDRVKALWELLLELPKIPSLLVFIIAFACFNDGVQTVITMASIYGKDVLGIAESSLIGTLLMIQFLGWPFTLLMVRFSKSLGVKRLLSISLIIWIGIVIYATVMQEAWQFWVLGGLVSVVLGVTQALPRAIYARLIPKKREAEFFSLYSFSGKFSAIIGPLFFGLIQDLSGSPRLAIFSLGAFFLIGLILLQRVSVDPSNAHRLD